MKQLNLLLLVAFLVTGICANAQDKAMFIYKKDASVKTVMLSDVDSISFSNVASNVEGCDIVHFYLDIYKDDQSTYAWRGDVRMQDQEQDPPLVKIDKENCIVTYTLPVLPAWFTPAKMFVFPAVIEVSEGFDKIEPNYNVPQDFSKDVVYTITNKKGEKKVWTIKAPKYYTVEKWNTDYATLRDKVTDLGAQNPNSIAIVGDYVALGRTANLLNKSDGKLSETKLNVTGWRALNGNTGETVVTQDFPFFITNDDAGNMLGINLGNWNTNTCAVYKWTSPTANPVEVMAFPTKKDDVQFGIFGRKLQVLGDVNGKGLIISPNNINQAARDNGEHYLWKINGGTVDKANPVVAQSKIVMTGNAYQILSPLGLDPVGPYYCGTSRIDDANLPNLQFGELGSMSKINGPFDNSWGNHGLHFLKLFGFEGKNMIATFSSTYSQYNFVIQERATNTTLVPVTIGTLEWNATDWVNGNATGGFTMEKVGNNILFYVFATNRAIVCYQLGKF